MPESDTPATSIPKHVAIIMDGNGRWAQQRGLPRWEGHRAGVEAVRKTLQAACELGIQCLTLYSFSIENWKRPPQEIQALMELLSHCLREECEQLIKQNIRLRHIGDITALPPAAQRDLRATLGATAHCNKHTLCLALNYGSRDEITRAVRTLATQTQAGTLSPEQIDESLLTATLDTAGLPDPDLLIRTAGELRLSNFLLWQLCYAELYVTQTFWPDFDADSLKQAIESYSRRDRRFGGLSTSPQAAAPTLDR